MGKKFQEDQLKDPSFKEWLKKVGDPRQCRCKVCQKKFVFVNCQSSFLGEHANGVKHKDALDKRKNLFKPIPKNVLSNV